MKKEFVVVLLAISVSSTTFAQKLKVPDAVTKAFNAKFPGATDIKWGKENAKEYEAEFKLNNTAISANFGRDGNWAETETTIKAEDLPPAVPATIKTKYPGAAILLAERVEKAGGTTYYEVVVKQHNKKKELELSADGKFMK